MSANLLTTVIPVTVNVVVDSTTGTPSITCSPDPVPVGTPNALINYTLVGPSNFVFATTNGIAPPACVQFPYPSWTTSSTSAQLFDLCTDALEYKYTVNLVNTTTGATVSKDPLIKNNNTQRL